MYSVCRGETEEQRSLNTKEASKPDAPGHSKNTSKMSIAHGVAARLLALVLAGVILQYLQPILVPLVLAMLLSFLIFPLVDGLTERGLPGGLAIGVGELVAMLPVLGVILVSIVTVGPLSNALPKYQVRLTQQVERVVDAGLERVSNKKLRQSVRRELSENIVPEVMAQGVVFAQASLRTVSTGLGYYLMTILFSVFILLEGRRFQEKFREAYGPNHPLLSALQGIGEDVRAYVVAKTWISALTGLFFFLLLEAFEVDFALFWGLLAFPLNFIPTVGAILASVPPILIAMIDPETSAWTGMWVSIGLMTVNVLIGTIIDPRFVGSAVKLSPLVVLLSMLVWGLLWGPIGMILAVPIMVSVKVVCSRIPALEPVATLMRG